MAGTFSRSVQIFKESFEVLKQDKELVLFPIISGVITILITASFMLPLAFLFANDSGEFKMNPFYYVVIFILYLLGYFVVIFFNTGLIACAHIRLNGGNPRFGDGLNFAMNNLGKIFGWSLVSATVGLILRIIRDRGGILGAIVAGLVGVAWNLLTFFVIPVMIFENAGVFDSIKRSSLLFKKTWGENVVLRFSVGFIIFLLAMVGVVPIALAVLTKSAVIIIAIAAVVVMYWAVLGVLSASLNGIFAAALYNYATTGTVPSAYSPELIAGAFEQKTRQGLFSR